MPRKDLNADVFQKRWVHSFEEDSAQAQVYRPQSWDFPLSRRPREAFELRPDGTAQLFLPGASDRPEATDTSWTEEAGELIIRAKRKSGQSPLTWRIVDFGVDKLVVRRP